MRLRLLLLVICGLSVSTGFAEESKVLATYDEGTVTAQDLENYWRYTGNRNIMVKSATGEQRVAKVVREVALREILLDYARDNDLDKAEGFVHRNEMEYERLLLDQLTTREIREKAKVTDEDIENYYESHPDEFRIPERFSIRYIFLQAPEDATEELKAAKLEQAKKVVGMLREGADFEQTALEYSDSEAQKGETITADVGQINPVLENAALNLEIDEISEPIETRHGYQIIQLVDNVPESKVPLDEHRDKIQQAVQREQTMKYRDELIAEVKELESKADVEYYLEGIKSVASIEDASVLCRIGDDFQITGQDVKRKLMRQSPERWQIASVTQAKDILENSFVLKEFCLRYAKQLGLDKEEDFLFNVNAEKNRVLTISSRRDIADKIASASPVSDAEVRKYYDEHPEEFTTGKKVVYEMVEVPIEVAADSLVAEKYLARRTAKEKADNVLRKAQQGVPLKDIPGEISGLNYSDGNEKVLNRETYMADLDRQLLDASAGQIPQRPVAEQERFIIFKVKEILDKVVTPFESVKEGLRNRLVQTRKAYVDNNLQDDLLKKHDFQLNEDALAGIELKFHDEE